MSAPVSVCASAVLGALLAGLVVLACSRSPDAAVRLRISSPATLTNAELAEVMAAAGRAMAGKQMRVRQGAVTRPLSDRERTQIFDVLSDPRGVEDVGLRTIGGVRARGLRVPATSPQSEIEATGTVWIDVASLLPCRYDFVYAAPGFGDTTLDLMFEAAP